MPSPKDGSRSREGIGKAGPKTTPTAAELGRMCAQLERILDWVEEMHSRAESRAERVARLRGEEKIPMAIAGQMQIILRSEMMLRNGDLPAIRKAWTTITEWAKAQGCQISS